MDRAERIIMYLADGSVLLREGEREQAIAAGATNIAVDAAAAGFFSESGASD